jgi:uncharacterized protein YukE
MSFEGMNVDQMQGLAKQIDADAQALYNLVNSLNGILAGLIFTWNGPTAAAFEQEWQHKNRPALLSAYTILTNLHKHLVDNINQQTSASAAEGGWTAERIVGDFENTVTALGLVGIPVSFLAETSKVMGVANTGLTGVGYVGAAIDQYHVQEDEEHLVTDLVAGHYVASANDLALGVSDELKAVSVPVGEKAPLLGVTIYAAGVDVKLLDEVANLDWASLPNPLTGDNWNTIYGPEFASMLTPAYWDQVGQTLWGAL